jgi:hypothetical protein
MQFSLASLLGMIDALRPEEERQFVMPAQAGISPAQETKVFCSSTAVKQEARSASTFTDL